MISREVYMADSPFSYLVEPTLREELGKIKGISTFFIRDNVFDICYFDSSKGLGCNVARVDLNKGTYCVNNWHSTFGEDREILEPLAKADKLIRMCSLEPEDMFGQD